MTWIFTTIIGKTAVADPGTQAVGAIFQASQWALAHATFYGDETASATMGIYITKTQILDNSLLMIV